MIIYKKYSQEQLDLQYNNRHHVPDFERSLQQWEKLSRLAEKEYKYENDILYGDEPRECLDIFPSSKPQSITLVFIHGGYWQKFDKSSFHFIAGAFADYNITTIVINYPLIPFVSMDKLIISCRKALDWIKKNIAQYNGDPEQLFIAGHSAGAHIAVMLMTGEKKINGYMAINGVCAISGIYNLIPIGLSNINDVLQMDRETAIRNSPVFKEPTEKCPLLLAAGSGETSEFLDQTRELYLEWGNKHQSIEMMEITGLNHFTILDSIIDKQSVLHQSIYKQMNI
jgi:arylformamidase